MLKTLSLNQIVPNPLNDYETTDISDMLVSIRLFGILQPPIVVGPNADDKYLLISGERRYLAAKALFEKENDKRFEKIDCVVNGPADMSEDKQKLLIETANIIVRGSFDRKLHALRLANLVLNVEDSQDDAIQHLMGALNCSKRYAMMLLNIEAKGVEEIHNMVQSTQLHLSDAERIANQAPQAQEEIVSKIKAGEPVKDVLSELPGYNTGAKKNNVIPPLMQSPDIQAPSAPVQVASPTQPPINSPVQSPVQPSTPTQQPPNAKIIDTLPTEPFKGEVFLAEELEKQIEEENAMSLEMFGVSANNEDLQNLSVNLSSVGALPADEDSDTVSESYIAFLKRMQRWCENIITKDELIEEEESAIFAMTEVVEHFF